jgi:alpha-ketoglutarate-dependent sulfate ester dioxygenase
MMQKVCETGESAVDSRRGFALARVGAYLGARITGIDLSRPLDELTVQALRSALLEHKVLFFGTQSLDHSSQVRLGEHFGELTVRSRPQDGASVYSHPAILTISPQIDRELHGIDYEAHYRTRWASGITGWHSDMTHVVNPPAASILRAEVVPPYGGDTQWSDLAAAYAKLSEPIRDLIDGLQAEHTFLAGYRLQRADPIDETILGRVIGSPRVALHPVVRVHPETGQKSLFVNPSRTARIRGMSAPESNALLRLLFEQLTRPEFTIRFSWHPGDVVMWDNRCTAHLAAADLDHLVVDRVLHRVTTIGDIPLGPDGFRSRALAGPALTGDQSLRVTTKSAPR